MLFTILKNAFAALENLYRREPVRVLSTVASAVVFVGAKLGVIVPEQSVLHALEYVVPIILSSEIARGHVSPAGDTPASK